MTYKKRRLTVLICNFVIAALCVLSIVSYFFMPFWKVDLSLTISAEMIESMVGDLEDGEGPENAGTSLALLAESSNESSIQDHLDVQEVVGEGITIGLGIEFETKDVLGALSGDSTASVARMLDTNVNKIVDALIQPITEIVKNTTKSVTKQGLSETAKTSVKEAFKNSNNEKTDEEVQQILEDAGITDEYLDAELDTLMTKMEEPIPVKDAVKEVTNILEDMETKLSQSEHEELQDLAISQEEMDDLEAEMEEFLQEFADENGNISLDAMLSGLFNKLNEENSSSENATPAAYVYTENQTQEEAQTKDLRTQLREMITSKLGEDIVVIITDAMQYVAYFILFTFFTWAYLIIKILVKLPAKNPAIKLKLPILLGWLPALILYVLPNAAISTVTSPSGILTSALDAETLKSMEEMSNMLHIQFSSSGVISMYIALALFLFVIVFYGRQRRALRKYVKAVKKGEISEDEEEFESNENDDYDM